ncbi:MAG: hypothetical protein KIS87_08880 [Phycisphaeraceae bacterium]|nr:hypothetical protein [Phycisphaeraceae bacterium]
MAERDAGGKFTRGNRASRGNRGGRPPNRLRHAVEDLMEPLVEQSVGIIQSALSDADAPLKDRIAAAQTVLAYRFGKPRQRIEVSGAAIGDLLATIDKARADFVHSAAQRAVHQGDSGDERQRTSGSPRKDRKRPRPKG